jgi:hypothetical protein
MVYLLNSELRCEYLEITGDVWFLWDSKVVVSKAAPYMVDLFVRGYYAASYPTKMDTSVTVGRKPKNSQISYTY